MSLFSFLKPKKNQQSFDQGAQALLSSLAISNASPNAQMFGPARPNYDQPTTVGGTSLADLFTPKTKTVAPVKAVRQELRNTGLGSNIKDTFGPGARADIKTAAKQPGFDPVQYTMELIRKASVQAPIRELQKGTIDAQISPNQRTMAQNQEMELLPKQPSFEAPNRNEIGQNELLYPDTDGNITSDNIWDSRNYVDGNYNPTSSQFDNSRSTNPNMIDAYSEDWMSDYNTGNVPTTEELRASGININKLRNAIATGIIDPYKLGVESGVPFTYDQLQGIQKGLAGSMDPAITDIQSRIATADKRETNGEGSGYSFGTNPALDVILGSGKFTKDQQRLIIQSIQEGEDPRTVILNQTKNIMRGPEASDLTKIEQSLNAMLDIDNLLKEYYANGGKSNIFSGKYEEVLNKLGTMKDPKLAGIGAGISIALQKYRNAVSGTAYSVQEGREIRSIFPSISNTQGLNDVLSQARIQALRSDIDSTYRNVLGSAYDSLKSEAISGSTGSSGSTRVINGVQYQMNPSDGKWYPLTKVGGGTNSASNVNSLQDAMRRIARNESDGSGGYKALGPKITNPKSQYYGQRAIGKYQVMEGNIAPWSKEILGYSVTPQQFYASPELQEQIVAGKMQQIYKKYGNWADVASVWFTGQPASKGANKKDVLGTSGSEYVRKFLS